MSKKKWKKKYKALQKQYDSLFCEYIRLKSDDGFVKTMTDEQILHYKEFATNLGNRLSQALKNMNH